jgi:hypothetical protein
MGVGGGRGWFLATTMVAIALSLALQMAGWMQRRRSAAVVVSAG